LIQASKSPWSIFIRHGWSVFNRRQHDEDFRTQLQGLNEELEALNAQAREFERTIAANVAGILGA